MLGSGIFTQDGQEWKHSRQLLRPQLAISKQHLTFEQMQKCVQRLIDGIPDDGIVDLQPLCFRLTFETTLFLLFGDSISTIDFSESTFAHAFNTAQDYLAKRGRLGPFYWFLNPKEFRDACRTCHDFINDAIAKARQKSDQVGGSETDHESDGLKFIDSLVQRTKDPQVLRDQCLNVMLAGRDTTACCLQWTL